MSFTPSPSDTLEIDNRIYTVCEHPAAPGMPYGQEGRQATVYQLQGEDGKKALKVFKERFSDPSMVILGERIAPFASLPGMCVCMRMVLTPSRYRSLLMMHPDLTYAVMMPWVEGLTWQEIVLHKQAIAPEVCLHLARRMAEVLVSLEERGIAHCDLSGPNVLVSGLETSLDVGLVDVEGLYGPGLLQPKVLPAGSPGYSHKTAPHGLWTAEADRFAGAVLLAEMLCWADPEVRRVCWGENYFKPEEMQVDSPRYQIMAGSLRRDWGDAAANLLTTAWHADSLSECPTLGKWLVALPDDLEAGRKIAAQTQNVEVPLSRTWECTSCGRLVAVDVTTCPYCETTTQKTTQPEINFPKADSNNKSHLSDGFATCSYCSRSYSIKNSVCPFCEGKAEIRPLQPEKTTKDRLLKWVRNFSFMGILLIGVLIMAGWIYPADVNSEHPEWIPDGSRIIFEVDPSYSIGSIPSSIWAMDPDGSNLEKLISTAKGQEITEIQISPDGSRIGFVTKRSGVYGGEDIWIMSVNGNNLQQLTFDSGRDYGLVWSPDSTKIIFISDRAGSSDIWVMDWNGKNLKQLTTFSGYEVDPIWSHDGRKIYFTSDKGDGEVWIMSSNGDDLAQITNISGSPKEIALSPIENKIAFALYGTSSSPNHGGIWIMNSDGGHLTRLVEMEDRVNVWSPKWSPDGSMIAFTSTQSGESEIWLIASSGYNLQQLTYNNHNYGIRWSPNGRNILYSNCLIGNCNIFSIDVENGYSTKLTGDFLWKLWIRFP